ncbi:MAG: hypothetical protein AB8B56_17550 [Crocinitomicaceae bacterium]
MNVRILEIDSNELIGGIIQQGNSKEMPSVKDAWQFNFNKHSLPKDKTAFILVKEDTPKIIEGCMIFSMHDTFGPFMDYLEVAPHNKGPEGKYKKVSGCLIAYACGLSFEKGQNEDRGILTFEAFSKGEEDQKKLEKFYRNKYGAVMNPFGYMEIHQNQSQFLIEEYLGDEDDLA